MFYVYEWFIVETNEIIYVGKGCKNRYKQTAKRNKIFQEFLKRFNCKNRIIKYFENEDNAFEYEHKRILELKNIGQAVCNLDYGGTGGTHFCWTNEMKEYKSLYNPMKLKQQRERMSLKNPMKNADVAKKVGKKHMRSVVINGKFYNGVKVAAKELNVCEFTITTWCKRGYDTSGNPCRYANETQKQYPITKITNPQATTPKAVIIDNIRFETVKDGAKYLNGCSECLIKAIKANRPYKGHNCRYDNQQPRYTNFDNSSVEGSTTNE